MADTRIRFMARGRFTFPVIECKRAAGKDAVTRRKKINSLCNTTVKDLGWKLWVGVSRLPQAEEDRERLPKKRRVLGDVKLVCGRCRACYFRDRISVRSRFYPADQVAK